MGFASSATFACPTIHSYTRTSRMDTFCEVVMSTSQRTVWSWCPLFVIMDGWTFGKLVKGKVELARASYLPNHNDQQRRIEFRFLG